VIYEIPELATSVKTLEEKSLSPSSYNSFTSTPPFDQLGNELVKVTTDTLLGAGDLAINTLGSTKGITNVITKVANNILPTIATTTQEVLNLARGIGPVSNVDIGTLFYNLGNDLLQQAEIFSTSVAQQVVGMVTNLSNITQMGNMAVSIFDNIDNISNFSFKQIRDLANEAVFGAVLGSTIQKSFDGFITNTFNNVQEIVSNSNFSKSGQQNLAQLSLPQFSGNNQDGEILLVRRTVYWAKGPNTDYNTANYKSSTGVRLQQGISAAVDNNSILYFSTLIFNDIGNRIAVDTGGAVKRRTASSGNLPVVDIFFDTSIDALSFANSTPSEVLVKVIPPKSKFTYKINDIPKFNDKLYV
jgi:3D (Asp-Asp-Asp) domain-containing protein